MPNFEKYNLSQVKLKGFINYLNIYSKMHILKMSAEAKIMYALLKDRFNKHLCEYLVMQNKNYKIKKS